MITDQDGLHAAELAYIERGWPVLPLVSTGKVPLVRHGLKDATTDRAQVEAWRRRWPRANVGIVTGPASGLLVVDLDGDDGLGSWARLEAMHESVISLEVETGGGGLHLYLGYPAAVELGNTAGRLGEGVDTRGKGGYVVAPPSIHPSGRAYAWCGTGEVAPAPRWLVAMLEPPKPRTEPIRRVVGDTDDRRLLARFNGLLDQIANAQAPVYRGGVKVRNGNRNERLFWAATKLREMKTEGAVPPQWEDILVRAGVARGLRAEAARKTVQSGLKGPVR